MESEILKCCVCDDPSDPIDNPIIRCNGCEIKIHVCCYGIVDIDDWKCSVCLDGEWKENAVCVLCSQNDGAMKKTTCNRWVHVICALFVDGVEFVDHNLMEPVDITKISKRKFNKNCVFCRTEHGCCIKCTKNSCKNNFHVSCAHNFGSLEEYCDTDGSIIFRGYCNQHKKKKRLSSSNVKNMLVGKRKESLVNKGQHSDADWILQSLAKASNTENARHTPNANFSLGNNIEQISRDNDSNYNDNAHHTADDILLGNFGINRILFSFFSFMYSF